MDPIDLLTLAVITWCGGDLKLKQYTKASTERCAEAIYDCAIDDKGKAYTENDKLKACGEKGKKLLIPIKNSLP